MKSVHFIGKRYSFANLKLVDLVCLFYLIFIGTGILIFHRRVASWYILVVLHILLFVFILEIVRWHQLYQENRLLLFLRISYPLLVYMLSWNEMNLTVTMVYGSHWATSLIAGLDKRIFGVHPTVWIQQFYQPLLDEIMNLFYTGYYLFGPLVLWVPFKRNHQEEMLAVLGIVTVTFATNFLLFYLFPALGPRMIPTLEALKSTDYSGFLLAKFTRFVQTKGSVRGACFPSAHISGALSWALAAYRYRPKLGRFMITTVIGISLSTVYLGYHHAVDPLAGIIWGLVGYWLAVKLLRLRNEDPIFIQSSETDSVNL